MSKADKMFEELGMKKKETQLIENGIIVKHIIEFRKYDDYYQYLDPETTKVEFNILAKHIYTINEHRKNYIEIVVATYEFLKELGWIE